MIYLSVLICLKFQHQDSPKSRLFFEQQHFKWEMASLWKDFFVREAGHLSERRREV